jgi:hypothetical protein
MNALTKHMIHAACSLILIFLLQGCISLGPDYVLPDADVETKWLTIADPQMRNTPPTDPKWWQAAFHDAMLDQLVEKALYQNLTLRSAGLRVLQSQQQLAIAVGAHIHSSKRLTVPLQGRNQEGSPLTIIAWALILDGRLISGDGSGASWSQPQPNLTPALPDMMVPCCQWLPRWPRTIF